ncbi:hypothetical protein J5X84_08555 [Streptosporangiaceae bacterium NEAU-GS5]|nr:hypothetical protein [Streptosporangiaceae bacterium NEAU-GS5]
MSTIEKRSTVGRRRLMKGGVLAIASALTMLVAAPVSAAAAPTTPTNLRPVFVDGVLKSIAWDASVSSVHVSYILYNNGPSGPAILTQTSKTSRTVRDLIYVDCLHTGVTLHLTIRALAADADHTFSEFSEQLDVTLPKTVPPRG